MLRHCVSGCLAGLLLSSVTAHAQISEPTADQATTQSLDLIAAAKLGDAARINALLDAGRSVSATEPDGSTALHWAAQRGNPVVVEALIDAGAEVDAANRYGVTALALAAARGDTPIVRRLLGAGATADSASREGQTPLMSAAANGRSDTIEALIDHGANVDAREGYRGQTALMWAAASGNVAAAQTLIDAGADIAARSDSGFTALLFAARNGEVEMLRILLENGGDPNDVGPDGTSAMNLAIVNAAWEAASVLLGAGADPNLPDPRGSPLHTIAWLRKPGSTGDAGVGSLPPTPPLPTGEVSSLELTRQLLAAGADPNVRIDWQETRFNAIGGTTRNPPGLVLGRHLLTYNGATAFYVAAKNGDAQYMQLLADAGADPTLPNRFGITPLMVAAGLDTWEGETPGPFTGVSEAERLEAVKLAVELGNDVNAVADFGNYPMTGEPEYTLLYYPHNIDELLDLGVGDPRWDDSTALHGAIISNQPSIVQYLVDAGAQLDARTATGWTPLMMSRGVFLTNTGREFPESETILLTALREQGLEAR